MSIIGAAILVVLLTILFGWVIHARRVKATRGLDGDQLREQAAQLELRAEELERTGERLLTVGNKDGSAAAYRKASKLHMAKGIALRAAQAADTRAMTLLSPTGDEQHDEDG